MEMSDSQMELYHIFYILKRYKAILLFCFVAKGDSLCENKGIQ